MDSVTLEELLIQPSTGTVATQQYGSSEGLPPRLTASPYILKLQGKVQLRRRYHFECILLSEIQCARRGLLSTGTCFQQQLDLRQIGIDES